MAQSRVAWRVEVLQRKLSELDFMFRLYSRSKTSSSLMSSDRHVESLVEDHEGVVIWRLRPGCESGHGGVLGFMERRAVIKQKFPLGTYG